MAGERGGIDGKRYGDKMTITQSEREMFVLRDDMLMFDVRLMMVGATHHFLKKYIEQHVVEPEQAQRFNPKLRVDFIKNGVIAHKTLLKKGVRGNHTLGNEGDDEQAHRITYAADLIFNDYLNGTMSEMGPCNIVIHEVAHYLDRVKHELEGLEYIYSDGYGSHSASWSRIVRDLGGSDESTLLVAKREMTSANVYLYRCVSGCPIETHALRSREHIEILHKGKVKRCKECKAKIKYTGVEMTERDGELIPMRPAGLKEEILDF